MHKARREMQEALARTDALIEVRDARLPASSANPVLAELAPGLPRLCVLTREDLADPAWTAEWLAALERRETTGDTNPNTGTGTGTDTDTDTATAGHAGATRTIALDLGQRDATRHLPALLDALAGPRAASRIGPRVAMIVGIPNVGKSTLINRLVGRRIAVTGNEPAVTKRQQSVALAGAMGDRWHLRDTPGVLWPDLHNVRGAFRLAASGAVRDTAMDSGEVAAQLLDELRGRYDAALRDRFGAALPLDEAVATLEAIGRGRGCLGGGGLVDFDRAARVLLDEFRSGRLGRLTLETPAMAAAEALESAARQERLSEQRVAKREARRARRKKSRANRR